MNNIIFKAFVMVALLANGVISHADVTVSGWVAQSVPGSKVGAAYLEVTNSSDRLRILSSVITHVSSHTMIHNIEEVDGVKRMRHMAQWQIQPHSTSKMKPGSVHIMMMGVDSLKAGERVPFTLKFKNGEEMEVLLPIKTI